MLIIHSNNKQFTKARTRFVLVPLHVASVTKVHAALVCTSVGAVLKVDYCVPSLQLFVGEFPPVLLRWLLVSMGRGRVSWLVRRRRVVVQLIPVTSLLVRESRLCIRVTMGVCGSDKMH